MSAWRWCRRVTFGHVHILVMLRPWRLPQVRVVTNRQMLAGEPQVWGDDQ